MGNLFNKKTFVIILAILIAALFIVKNLIRSSVPSQPSRSIETPQSSTKIRVQKPVLPSSDPAPDAHKYVIDALTSCGWTLAAAESVYDLNQPLLDQSYDLLGKEVLEKEFLSKLRRLGQPEYQQTLADCPEIASLLASALDVDPDGAHNIIQTLPVDAEGKQYMYGFYQMNADPDDAVQFAQLFQDVQIRDKYIELLEHSPNAFSFLTFLPDIKQLREVNEAAADAYRAWLFELFDEIVQCEPGSRSEEQIAFQLQIFSSNVKKALLDDPEFYRFLPDCWSNFQTAIKQTVSEDRGTDDEALWDFLNMDPMVLQFFYVYRDQNPIELYTQYGPAITGILMSSDFVNPENRQARDRMVRLALAANDNTRFNLINSSLENSNGFVTLLNRNLSDHVYFCMFDELAQLNSSQSSQTPAQRIGYWNSLSNKVLAEEFDQTDPGAVAWIPGYDIVRLSRRSWNGQQVTWGDVGFAAVDAAFIVFDLAAIVVAVPSGGGSIVAVEAAKAGTKAGAKAGTKAVVKAGAKTAAKKTLENMTKEAAKTEAKKSVWGTFRVFKNANRFFANEFKKLPSLNIDITKFVQYAFSQSKVGQKTFKKMSGLDARCFMRSDRRVLLDVSKIPQTQSGTLVKRLLGDTAAACGMTAALSTETGQAMASQAVETTQKTAHAASRKAEEIDKAWKRNLSLWWFANQRQ